VRRQTCAVCPGRYSGTQKCAFVHWVSKKFRPVPSGGKKGTHGTAPISLQRKLRPRFFSLYFFFHSFLVCT